MAATPPPLRILVSRPDRLGDVILSTPVLEVIKRHYPKATVTLLVRADPARLVGGLTSVDETLIFDPEGRHAGFKGFFRLVSEIRERGFRIAVSLQSHWKIAAAILLARVRYRVGPLSKPHSYLCYNRGVRQRRSHVEMHEADYNLQLLRRLGIRVGTRNVPTAVHVSDAEGAAARSWLEGRGWPPGETFVVVHPGMGGSALNWPENHYVELIRALARDGRRVLVTFGPTEQPLLKRVSEAVGSAGGDRVIYYGGADAAGIERLGALLSLSALVIAPSTGPLHVAVALGKPVVAFYPPVRVQSAIRWGPYLRDASRAAVLVPEVYCGEDFACRGSLCNYFPCMKSLSVSQALARAGQLLESERSK
jgi:ADP-heptose:LPS heptosyltransferase